MQFTHRFLGRCLALLVVIVLAAGCSFARRGVQRLAAGHLADTATSYNLAIEQTQDEMLLLNVIRAQDNYPLFLTDASKVTGTVKADISLGLKIPLVHAGSANGNDYFGTPSLDYSSSPSMDVNLLNAKDFMTGFLTPIRNELFAYYWDQDWDAEFLLYLLVHRVDVYAEGAKPTDPPTFIRSLYNYPNEHDANQTALRDFSEWVHALVCDGRPLLCSINAEGSAIGPSLDREQLELLKFLVPVAKEGLSLEPAGTSGATIEGKWQLRQPKRAFFLVPQGPAHAHTCPTAIPPPETHANSAPDDKNAPHDFRRQTVIIRGGPGGQRYELTLRSPEGLLYYLGELARLENHADPARALMIHLGDYSDCTKGPELPVAPLFVALDREQHSECQPIIWVRSLDGSDYLIPKGKPLDPKNVTSMGELHLANVAGLCTTGETMHALELLSQLIGLQKTAKDFSTTSTVKVVGQ
ncbi:MAG TPA: hypothetical protein VHR45_14560 [Thermoanaerobaculia bacterium]|nr:hypothetical protein [Thermoanaerobaculia bacterium]